MLCDVCGKNPATVHLTEIIDDQMNELHLCEECARKKSTQMDQQFGLSDLLAGMADFDKPGQGADKETIDTIKCPNCGLTYADFKKMGRLGCGDCYEAFKKYLGPLLKKIHGSSMHFGKTPFKSAKINGMPKNEIEELRLKLKEAVAEEDFEDAARLRDQIKELENKQKA